MGHRVSAATADPVALGVTTGTLRPPPVHAYRVAPASANADVRRNERRENNGESSCPARSYLEWGSRGGLCTAAHRIKEGRERYPSPTRHPHASTHVLHRTGPCAPSARGVHQRRE